MTQKRKNGLFTSSSTFAKDDFRSIVPRFQAENLSANQVLVNLVRNMAEGKGATPAQIAIAWVVAQKPLVVPIPGTPKLSRLADNLSATEVVLKDDELKKLNEAISKVDFHGSLPACHAHDGPLASCQYGHGKVDGLRLPDRFQSGPALYIPYSTDATRIFPAMPRPRASRLLSTDIMTWQSPELVTTSTWSPILNPMVTRRMLSLGQQA